MSILNTLTDEQRFYEAMHKLAQAAWRKNMTVDALLTLTELLDLPDDPPVKAASEPGS